LGANREGFRRKTGVMRCKRRDPDVNEILALALSQQPLRRRGPQSSNAVAQFLRTPNVTEQAHLPKDGAVVFQSPMRAVEQTPDRL